MNRLALFLPLSLFAALTLVLMLGLDKDPTELPSALVDEPFPSFSMPSLQDHESLVSKQDFADEVLLVNVWATWCFACRIEHPSLNALAEQGVKIVGLNYKDQRKAAKLWLLERGNPYLIFMTNRAIWELIWASMVLLKPIWWMPRVLFAIAGLAW